MDPVIKLTFSCLVPLPLLCTSMAKIAVLFVTALALSAVLAAPKKTQGKGQLDDAVKQVQTIVNDVSTSLQNILPDNKQTTDFLREQSQQVAQNMQVIVDKLQVEIDKNKGKIDDGLKQINDKLVETIGTLKDAVGQDAVTKATEIRTQLANNFKTAANEVEEIIKVVQPNMQQAGESINNFAKGVLDDFLKIAENLKTQVDSAIQTSQKGQKPK